MYVHHRQCALVIECRPTAYRSLMSSQTVERDSDDDQWRRPGAEFGGTEKIFADQNFSKISIFMAKIFDDFFSHRPGFSDFLFLFPDFTMLNVVYDHLLTR